MTSARNVEIAKWLVSSGIDFKSASVITGLPQDTLRVLHGTLTKHARRAFLASELDIAISALGAMRGLTFVQVGANDGKSGDPIFKHILTYGESALLIEPQPWLAEPIRLAYKKYRGKLFVESIAIGTEAGTLGIHVLKEEHWDEYLQRVGRHPNQIASPVRSQILKRVARRLDLSMEQAEAYVGVLNVEVKPLSRLLPEYGLATVDVLQIDCEGWDYNVIKSFGDYRPAIINFDSSNLTSEDWRDFVEWSKEAGYGFIQTATDTLAMRGFSGRYEL